MIVAAGVANHAMRHGVEPIGGSGNGARRQSVGKVVWIDADVGEIVGRPSAGVDVVPLDGNIDFGAVVVAGLFARGFRAFGGAPRRGGTAGPGPASPVGDDDCRGGPGFHVGA